MFNRPGEYEPRMPSDLVIGKMYDVFIDVKGFKGSFCSVFRGFGKDGLLEFGDGPNGFKVDPDPKISFFYEDLIPF